jgi:DNA-binding transcriptional MerR regulator
MSTKTFTVGQLAERTGLTRRALRLYEENGLLIPERRANGYRVYTERHLQEAQVIKELRASSLSLEAIQALFTLKRSTLPTPERLSRCLEILDRMSTELLQKCQAIDLALARLEQDRRDIQLALEETHDELDAGATD